MVLVLDVMGKIAAFSILLSTWYVNASSPRAKGCDWICVQVVMLDQRGAGKSTPYVVRPCPTVRYLTVLRRSACLEENTTWDLVKDVELLREHLSIEKWHVFGGSWVRTPSTWRHGLNH